MKGVSKFIATLFTFAFSGILAVSWFSCQLTFSQQVVNDKAIQQTNVESRQPKKETKPKNDYADCLNAKHPKRKYIISAGVLNARAIDIPKPEYPAKARAEKVAGEVKVSVVVEESGKVVWARVDNGHPLLQEAVKKVVCQAVFKPATISGHPYSFSGLITYRFVSSK